MNIDFVAAVNKTSGAPIKSSGSSEMSASGFLEQINQAMRDNDRKNESTVEKKPTERKKTSAAEAQNSAKTDVKTSSSKKKDHSDLEYADAVASAAQSADGTEETSEELELKLAITGDDDSGFYDELEKADIPELENAYASAPLEAETSEIDSFEDTPVSVFADAQISPAALVQDDSEFATMMNMKAVAESASYVAVSNAFQKVDAIDAPITDVEAVTPATAGRTIPVPQQETTDANIYQKPSFFGESLETSAENSLKAVTDDIETAVTEPTRPIMKEAFENDLSQKNQMSSQNSEGDPAASLRGGTARNEISAESRTSANAEIIELSKQPPAQPSEDDVALLERLSAQTSRQREDAALVKTSENAGKTVKDRKSVV